ncbi:cytochrome c oxidase assembly protein [Azospirillum brasilense]|nr:cytochrome c oxidase assembly protein [Azospirillum brasilense]
MNDRREGDKGLRGKNRLFMAGLFGLVFGMVGLAYASVPLYALFCQVTGFGGTTQRADAAPARQVDRVIKVRFNADVNQSLPWRFKPEQKELTVKLGEMGLAAYQAANRVDRPTVGTALYNVTPDKVGKYFNKIECFCFTEQVLEPGQSVDMPVAFFVDPALADDPAMEDVTTITLSYTFFRAKDGTQGLAQHATQAAGAKGPGTGAN